MMIIIMINLAYIVFFVMGFSKVFVKSSYLIYS